MTDWTLIVEEAAPVLAAVSALLIYGADRIVSLWNWFTARDRRLASLQRMDPSIGKVLSDLRVGAPSTNWSNLSLLQFVAPTVVLLASERIPGGMVFVSQLLGLASYLVFVTVLTLHQLREVLPKLLSFPLGEPAWSQVRLRYHLLRNFRLAVVAVGTGAATALFSNPGPVRESPFFGTVTGVGFLAYSAYLFLRVNSRTLEYIESSAYSLTVRDSGNAPDCKVWLMKRKRAEPREIDGRLNGIGDAFAVLRDDGFVEEIEWDQISTVALKPRPVVAS